MTMQLKQISLYGHNGERRDVKFELDAVNIITGASKKGKTSLINIVEYCLGSSECNIAVGCIRDTVAWYSILLQFHDSQVFIARATPKIGAKSNSIAHMLVEKQVEIPNFTDLTASTNIDSVVSFLTSKIGIPEFITEVPSEQTRSKTKIGFKHSRHYLFQSQYEIADPKLLFHRQGEPHIPQSIKDTLPYFIGAAEDDRLADVERLRSLKQDRARLKKKINEIESIKGEGLEKGFGLLAEASEVGLYNGANLIPSENELLEIFSQISDWKPNNNQQKISEATDEVDPVLKLERDCRRLSEQKQVVRIRLREAAEYENSENGFQNAVEQQVVRLKSLGLFDKLTAPVRDNCSVCDGTYSGNSSFSQIMHRQLTILDKKLDGVSRNRPRVQSYVTKLKQEQQNLAQNIKRIRESLNAIQRQNNAATYQSNIDVHRALVVGRISLYMEGITWQKDTSEYKQKLVLIEPQITSLI